LYIEDTEIKLLVTSGKQVEKWASLLLEPKLVRDGVIIDEERVAEGIKTMFKLEGIGSNKVVVGLGGLNSIFRVISLPEISQAMLPEAVINEAGRVIPVPLDMVYLSYQQIPSPKGETHLFLVAYPRNSTDALIRTLIKAGLKPQVMDLAPLALCRCANVPRAVIINSWLTYLDIVVMSDSMPQPVTAY
jgi:type IV pilus assembly protein PilM